MRPFPNSTLLAALTCATILFGVHYAVAPNRGLDPATLAAPFSLAAIPTRPATSYPLPGVSDTLAVPNPTAPGWSPVAAANLTLTTDNLYDRPDPAQTGPLDHFYAALADLSEGRRTRPVRIVHYGDSPTTADLITGDARELLQARFGDAGPGFILVAKPWAWYGHHGIEISENGWQIATAVGQQREGEYGLGGANFTGSPGTETTLRLDNPTSTSIEVQFLQRPGGGNLTILADGNPAGTVSTAGESKIPSAVKIALPEGTKVAQMVVNGGDVVVYGVAFSTEKPGLTYDSIGLNGASTTVMSRAFNPENWSIALAHRDPDLVIINYGTNESGYLDFVNKQYEGELRRAISRVKSAVPNASILIMSPMDRGDRSGSDIATLPGIPRLVEIQQRVAAELNCGFFNTYASMGGSGTMQRWYDGHPRLVGADLIHPTPQGARIVAQHLTGQLLIGYERYRQRHTQPAVKPQTTAQSIQNKPLK